MLEILIGVAFWVVIFLVWYSRNYPDKMPSILKWRPKPLTKVSKTKSNDVKVNKSSKEYRRLVELIENICALDRFGSSDAAGMVHAVKRLIEMEKSSGQIWEAYALDALESAEIWCDDCKRPVKKIVDKSGVRIECAHCDKWLELKNSKVTILDFPKKNAGSFKN